MIVKFLQSLSTFKVIRNFRLTCESKRELEKPVRFSKCFCSQSNNDNCDVAKRHYDSKKDTDRGNQIHY